MSAHPDRVAERLEQMGQEAQNRQRARELREEQTPAPAAAAAMWRHKSDGRTAVVSEPLTRSAILAGNLMIQIVGQPPVEIPRDLLLADWEPA